MLLCVFMLRLSRDCLLILAYNLLVEMVGVSQMSHGPNWCHMAPIGVRKVATCFLGKNSIETDGRLSVSGFVILWLGALHITLFL